MTMNPYLDIHRSILAYCNQFLIRNSYSPSAFEVFDYDAHAVVQELPAKHLIGISDYSIENQTDMYMVTCVLAVCTMSNDQNLTMLYDVMGKLFSELRPGASGERFAILDETGLKRGYLTVGENVMAMPVGRTDTRPFQGIAISFGAGYLALP